MCEDGGAGDREAGRGGRGGGGGTLMRPAALMSWNVTRCECLQQLQMLRVCPFVFFPMAHTCFSFFIAFPQLFSCIFCVFHQKGQDDHNYFLFGIDMIFTAPARTAKVHDWDPVGWWFNPQCSQE